MQHFAEIYGKLWKNDRETMFQLLDALGFGVVLISRDRHEIIYANEKLLAMGGYKPEDLLGRECHKLMCPAEKGHCPIDDLDQAVDDSERMLCCLDGSRLPIIKTVVPLETEGKRFLLESFVDISKQKEMQSSLAAANATLQQEVAKRRQSEESLRHLAYHDSLTELPNHLFFMEVLEKEVQEESANFAVISLNFNGFKLINTTMSHAIGDVVLCETAKRLQSVLPPDAILAHFGGDEFAVLYKAYNEKLLQKFLKETGRQINKPFQINEQAIFMTATMGIALYPKDGPDAETLLQNASIAMRTAKEEKRQWTLCTDKMKREVNEYMLLSNQLFRSLEREELLLYYQPQVDCRSGAIVGLEALVRWNHSEWGLISPGKFIPIAENNGFINSLGEWVLRTACQQNKAWQEAGLERVPVAVNLSAVQFNNPNLVAKVAAILEETGLEAKYLELEVTESLAMRELESVVEALRAFVDMGILIALDDFGTDYSCMQYLKRLPIGKLKIAMPFVRGITVDSNDEAVINSMLVLAEQMKLRILAEGVELESQLQFLCAAKCYEIQGYYFSKPLPAEEISNLLLSQSVFAVKC